MSKPGVVIGVVALLVGAGAFVFALIARGSLQGELDQLKAAQEKDRTGFTQEMTDMAKSHSEAVEKLGETSAKTERLSEELAGLESKSDGLETRVAESDSRLGVLEQPARMRKDVEQDPGKYVRVLSALVFNRGSTEIYAAIRKLEVKNESGADIVWIEFEATYFEGGREVGSKRFALGDAAVRNPENAVLPRRQTVMFAGRTDAGRRYLDAPVTQITGEADEARVEILGVKLLD
ncbi:MAG: hypothetical protein ACYTAF_11445 [Planctomycetota bacterium]|jgi:hypothetical protein